MKLFQRILSFCLLCCLLFSLAACGKNPQETNPTTAPTSAPTQATEPVTEPTVPAVEQKVKVDVTDMTELQKAVCITAESYLLRGVRAQYDQYNLTKSSSGMKNVTRRLTGVKAPEDYTIQNYGYTDCSGFVYDVYNFALNMSITDGNRNTKAFCEGSIHTILCEYPERDFGTLTPEEITAKENKFAETLQPGDIIVYRKPGNTAGHAMLYVGNGMIIHSTGSTYDFTNAKDKVEKDGTYKYDSIWSTLLQSSHTRYLMKQHVYIIMRPLNKFQGQIPAATQARMNLMRGVVAEKLSSHSYGETAAPGDTITYTFKIKNDSNVEKVLTVTDTLSQHTSYVSGADQANGNTLSWTVTVPAGQMQEFSYTVVVNANAPLGEYIVSNSSISGVPVNCQRFKIAKTLSADQQTAVAEKFTELSNAGFSGIQLVNAMYEQILGKAVFTQQTTDEIWADLVTTYSSDYVLNPEGALYAMIAPSLYGGKNMCEMDVNTLMAQERTRLLSSGLMIPGDVVLADNALYIYTGEYLVKISTAKVMNYAPSQVQTMLANNRFVVLRPSMVQ